MEKIRVLCVDDSPEITELYRVCINDEKDMCCVGTLREAGGLGEAARETGATVVLLDLTMPGADPIDAVRAMAGTRPGARVLVFSGYDDAETLERVLDAGAWGLVSKHDAPARVLDAIRRIAAGEVVVPRSAQP